MAALALAGYIGAIVTANVMTAHVGLVPVGFGLVVTAGTFAAGLALLMRDAVHRTGGLRLVLAAIAVGAVLSWALASPGVAVASGIAFAGAEIVDLLVYVPVARHSFVTAALASNVVSAPVDTVLFLHLAGFGITAEAVGGQLIAKVMWATALPLVVYLGARRALLRQPQLSEGA